MFIRCNAAFLIWVTLLPLGHLAAEDRAFIATVNGEQISQSKVAVSEQERQLNPNAARVDKLHGEIRNVLMAHAIKNYGIMASESEVKQEVDAKFQSTGLNDKEAKKIIRMYGALAVALEQWQQDKTQGTKIYKEVLEGLMTLQEWEIWQKTHPKTSDLNKLRKLIPQSLDDMKANSLESSKKDILYRKLIGKITESVLLTEEEQRTVKANCPKDQLKDALEKALEKKKAEAVALWWKKQLRQASIEILDDKLRTEWQEKYAPEP